MRAVYCIIILFLFISGAFAQNVATINGKPISNKEFMWFYKKNHGGNANASVKDLEAYLNQYINFKLKVLDARDMGLDTDTAYLAEIKNYETTLAAQKRVPKTSMIYSMLMNEYKEAALMFNVSEIKIWNKSKDDQDSLERDWMDALKKKYTVKINQNEVKKLAKL
ncbi:MAG: hypothetical protein P0Y49_01245 [Candidatus Pedobacter colombiensis]|uniref:Peptidylprolyl isomerase n=1 Tax=Candidatus Pedobacter colombiensis TaxID=3121371 RepID=A0AAJ5W9Z2_9SPHI|nr:hypothetical protein [Pedobacter sp.]WEK19780.1 MAG: hypothetical protein P0Y49_01245 [Pedobacter sp.]